MRRSESGFPDRPVLNPDRPESQVISEKLLGLFERNGIHGRIVELVTEGRFPRAVIAEKPSEDPGKTEGVIRLYRGVAHLDENILNQVPYALRTWEGGIDLEGHVSILEHAREIVEDLAAHPTAEKLYAYVDTVWPDLTDEEIRRFDAELKEIEDGVLDLKISLRWAIMFTQYGHGSAAFADTGITPYMPAALEPDEALGYAREGMLVLDMPMSQVEFPGTTGEVHIKGVLKPKYISAILPVQRDVHKGDEEQKRDLKKALQHLEQFVPQMISNTNQTQIISGKIKRIQEEDRGQWEHDVSVIRLRRTKILLSAFGREGLRREDIEEKTRETGGDVYVTAKQMLFDLFVTRAKASGCTFVDDWEYGGRGEKIDREKVNEEMLEAMRRRAQYYEARFQEKRRRSQLETS